MPRIVELPPDAVSRIPAAIAAMFPADTGSFLAVVELGYLAASADGLDRTERELLAGVLERATGERIDHEAFDAHFADLDEAVAMLGRRERLARTAADFDDDTTRGDAIRIAALIAMADGSLNAPELVVLNEVGAHFAWSAARVRALVDDAAARLGGGA